MTLQRTTLYQAGVSLIICGAVVALFILAVGLIRKDGQQLSSQFAAMTEQTSREAAVLQLRRTADETVAERAQIAEAFLPGEGAAVAFLSQLEQTAPEFGVGLDVLTLAKKPESETTAWLVVSMMVRGPYDDVSSFIAYLETVPYRSYAAAAALQSQDGKSWSAEVELLVSERSI